jgi:hypothetical protein
MRNRLLVAFSIVTITSGCAGSVIFGHTIGQPKTHDQPPAVTAAPAPTPAQPAQTNAPSDQGRSVQAPPPVQVAVAEPTAGPAVRPGKFKAASVAWAPAADAKVTADPRFNRDQLLAAVTDALRAHQLLDDGGKVDTDRTLAIVIDDFATRAGSNAVVLGYSFTRATLAGHVEVRGASGGDSERFAVMAESRLAAAADADQSGTLKPLYRRFADIIVSRLTGVPLKATTELPR